MEQISCYEIISIQQANRQFYLDLIVAIITFISAVIIYIDYKNRKNKEKAEKSINIAEEFAQSIIPKLNLLYDFFEKTGLIKIVNKYKFFILSDFDIEELHELYDQKEIEEYTITLNKSRTIKIKNNDNAEEELDMGYFITILLNELEHMCMYIATNVADEKYIYNSLHQQFLKTISLLYISISLINIDAKDKYYTNIIHVYNLWTNKYIKAIKKEEKYKKKQKKEKQKLLPKPQI